MQPAAETVQCFVSLSLHGARLCTRGMALRAIHHRVVDVDGEINSETTNGKKEHEDSRIAATRIRVIGVSSKSTWDAVNGTARFS